MARSNTICDSKYDRRKLLLHPKRIGALLETGDAWPITVNTGFTTYCNHSCVWCSSAYTTRVAPSLKGRDKLIIQPDVWIRNIRILAERGTSGLIIAGQGEPLLHPAANDMLEAAADAGLRYMLFSNGQRLNPKLYETFFRGAAAIRFSVDAGTEATHTRWHAAENANGRGRADFNQMIDNIRALVTEKRKRGARFPDIGCQMISSKLTESDFEAFAELFSDIGVDYIAYKSLQRNISNQGISVSSLDLHETEEERAEQARRMLDRLLAIKARFERPGFEVHVKVEQIASAYVKEFNGAERYSRCRAHPLVPMIEPDGKVYLCIDHGGNDDFVIGNIYDDDIATIWASQQRREVISRIDLKGKCPAGCFLDEANHILDQIADPDPHLHPMLI
ncbi:radical SAM protein [Azospirillum sp. YIM B02556]|uniref:Radical SAM protein n=1 Tax=Azospirillum endophyticum TaxID=2800326 RepID=A0ABS1FBI5_9PROT|nr:radical SAM protein [Azospirillum endophyticum]MBK1840788.1 radical SAM protein [Azospirillum endophyticum]